MPFRQGAHSAPRSQRLRRLGRTSRCLFEALENRRLLSAVPLASPHVHGPLAQYADAAKTVVPPGSRPTSTLGEVASPLLGSDSYTFSVTYRDDVAVRATSIDRNDVRVVGPNGYERSAAAVTLDSPKDDLIRVAHYTIAAPGGGWDASADGRYRIELRPNEVSDIYDVAANGGTLGEFTVAFGAPAAPAAPESPREVSLPPTESSTGWQFPPIGLDVRDFGAIPNDAIDDTDAIQRAIDALPDGHGVPGYVPTGGIVYLPAGSYLTSRALRMHSGITLRGDGPTTIIRNISTDRTTSAILLDSPFTHRFNVAASLQNLTIHTSWSKGITIDPNMGGDVNDLRLANLRISSFGPAIDLRNQAVYFSDFENIEVYNPGSTALHLGRINDGYGAVNLIRNFRVTGAARGGFTTETAFVYIDNHAYIDGMHVSTSGVNILPLYLSGAMTINGLDMQVPAANCPGGIAVHFNKLAYALIDRFTNIGTGRRLLLTNAHDVQITEARSDGTSDLVSQLALVDAKSSLRIGNALGGRLQAPAAQPTGYTRLRTPTPATVIDARDFGVVANDGLDDSAALQRAIDSLSSGGVPAASVPERHDVIADLPRKSVASGGIVQIPHGILNLSTPIKLPSNVWLRGHESGTVLENPTLGGTRAVIELTSADSTRGNVNAGIVDLMISSGAAAGIRSDSTVTGDVLDLRISGVRVLAGGPSIDLRNVTVNHAIIERVAIYNPGSTALWLGKSDNSSVGNLVRGLRMVGTARPGFVAEKALVVLHGQTRVESGSIEELFTNVLPFYASGSLTALGVWMEYPIQPNNVGFVLDNLQHSYIDSLIHVSPERRLLALNNSNVTFGHLNISGYTVPLNDCILVDTGSLLTINTVYAQFDSGLLDHPRVVVKGAFNKRSDRFVSTPATLSANYVADPDLYDVSDSPFASWTLLWGDTSAPVTGTWAVETVEGQKRLKLTVLNNPNNRRISVRVKLNVPTSAIGRNGVASWRIDTNNDVFIYTRNYAAQYQGRVRDSKTAVAKPGTLSSGEEIWIDLPQAQGTYYIWKVGMVAV